MRQPHDDYWRVKKSTIYPDQWVVYLMSATGTSQTTHLAQNAHYSRSWQAAMDYVNCEIAIRI